MKGKKDLQKRGRVLSVGILIVILSAGTFIIAKTRQYSKELQLELNLTQYLNEHWVIKFLNYDNLMLSFDNKMLSLE